MPYQSTFGHVSGLPLIDKPNSTVDNLYKSFKETREQQRARDEQRKAQQQHERELWEAPMQRQKGMLENQKGELEAQYAPEKLEQEMAEGRLKGKYSEREIVAKLAEQEAHAKYWEQGGGRGMGGNVWMRLPQDARADMIAQGNAWNFSPEVVAAHIGSGGTMDELKEEAKKNGVDVENAEKQYNPTGSNRTKINEIKGASAELDYLEQVTTPGISRYGGTFDGYSPQQIAEAISGKNIDEQVDFYAARAVQPEIAGARSRITGGSNASEALHDAQTAALGTFKIFEGLLTPEIREKVQHKINEWLKEAAKVRTKTISGSRTEQKAAAIEKATPKKAHEMTDEEWEAAKRGK